MIAQLKAMIGLDSRQYVAGARQVQGTTQRMQSSFRSIGRMIGISFSIAGVIAMTRAITRWASDISIAARNAGVLTSEMVAFNRVALQTGLQTSDMQKLLATLQDKLMDAADGGGEAQKMFERMGLTVTSLIRMDPAEMFQEVARAATQTGVPISNLIDLFGRQLGPNARAALEEIAKNGLPEVDEALGHTIDRVEELGSEFAKNMDIMKQKVLEFAAVLHNNLVDTFAGLRSAVTGQGFIAGISQAQEAREERITERRRGREEQREREKEERLARYKLNLQEQLTKLREEEQIRIQQTDRLRGTAPALSGMEQMGAAFGGDRTAALRTADRQLQVAREQLRVQEEFSARITEIKDRLDSITREM